MVDCGLACATSEFKCGLAITNQVLSALIVAANLATLGITSGTGTSRAATTGVKSVTIGSKAYRSPKTVAKILSPLYRE